MFLMKGSVVSDRADVSQEVLDKHYDEQTGEQKREIRKTTSKISKNLGVASDRRTRSYGIRNSSLCSTTPSSSAM